MKILFLSHYFPPEVNAPATRTYEHCVRWVAAGHSVTVVTCNPNHPHGQLYPGYENRVYSEEVISGVRVIRLLTLLSANKGFGLRTLNYIWFLVMTVLMCARFGKHDVVISTSPQFFNGLAGYFLSRFKRIPWVLEIRDLWPESIVAVGAMRDGFVTRMLYRLEMFCYRACDLIVPVTDSFREYMIAKRVPARKIKVVKNGVDLSLFNCESENGRGELDRLFDKCKLNDRFIAAYVGTHGMAHHLETILEAAEQLRERDDIGFLLVGDGAERERLLQIAQDKALTNVSIVGQLPKSVMPELWSRVHLSLILLRRSDTFKSVIPSKIFESLAMQKPIILGVEGESADLVNESGAGICIAPESATELAEAVLRLAEDNNFYSQLAGNGRSYVYQHYDRNILARRFVESVEQLVVQNVGLPVNQGPSND